jgi:hypothetical protein
VKIISFQYSERTIGSTETNDTSTERSDTQLFRARKSEGVALSGGLNAHLQQKDIEKKVNLTKLSQEANFFLTAPILFLYYDLSVCPLLWITVLRQVFYPVFIQYLQDPFSTSILFEFLTLPSLLQHSQKFLFILVAII